MAYDSNIVKAILRRSGGIQEVAKSVGQGENSTQAQHEAAIQFFEVALALEVGVDDEALGEGEDRAFATAEIARHRAALAPLEPRPSMGWRSQPKAV